MEAETAESSLHPEGRQPGRVLIVASEFPPGPGGVGTHAYQAARELCRRGWQVVVVTPQEYASRSEIAAFNDAQPFRIVRLRAVPGSVLEAVYREATLLRWIHRLAPHVILASGSRAVLIAALGCRVLKLPWMAVGHGSEFGLGGLRGLGVRWAFRGATAVVCVSQYTLRRMHAVNIHPRAEFAIPNGADRARFRVLPAGQVEDMRTSLGLARGRLLLTVGHVTSRKGQDVVVRALPTVLRRVPDAYYLVAGLPTQGRELLDLAVELGVASHVRLLGRVGDDELVRLLNACDVFVLTSRETADGDLEGYGIAVVEAALCGKPAVVSGDSGLAEAVLDKKTGFIVPQNDEEATARAILSLLEDEATRQAMGEKARNRAVSEQTWEECFQRYDEILRQLISKPKTVVRGRALGTTDPAR